MKCPDCGEVMTEHSGVYDEGDCLEMIFHCENCLSDWTAIIPHEMVELQRKFWG